MLCLGTSSATSSPLKKEQPLFTLRQVGMICERLLKEREEKVREEYEEILNTKLAGMSLFSLPETHHKECIISKLYFMSIKLPLSVYTATMFSKNPRESFCSSWPSVTSINSIC